MNKGIIGVLSFIAGGAIASVVTWKLVQKKYEKEAEEEIDQMRLYYQNKRQENDKRRETVRANNDPVEVKKQARRASDIALREGYVHYSSVDRRENTEETNFRDVPYLIDEDTFYNDDDYEKIEWTYYADGILADENEDPIKTKEIESSVGMEALGHFGTAEEIYVRNDRLKANYLINKDKRKYKDVYGEV